MGNALREGTMLQGRAYRYRVERMLRQGSFGITYLARVELAGGLGRIDSNTFVAIKEFFMCDINGRQENTVTTGSQGGLYANYKRKFAREAENLSRIDHPHIVKVLEYFEANNTVYYAMEYIDGGSLDERIAQRGGLTEAEGKAYARQIAEALAYMHAHKMLHLDLKPGNVMLRRSGEAVLIDFGLSKQYDENGNPESSTTVGGGTPGYAPIEQANYHEGKGFPVTMDVYALGATLFKMLTGVRPPDASDMLNDGFPAYELQKRGVSESTIACVAKAMASLKAQRYPNVTAFIAGLGSETTELGGQRVTRRDSGRERTERKTEGTKTEKTTDGARTGRTKTSKKGSTLGGLGITVLVILALNILIRTPWSETPTATSDTSEEVAVDSHLTNKILEEILNTEASATESATQQAAREREENERLLAEERERQAREEETSKEFEKGLTYYNQGNFAEAVKWWRKAAEQGNASAQCNLGTCYENGLGVAANNAEAVKWYRKAAEQGNAEAQNNLGACYVNGRGVAENHAEAVKWYRKAVEQGNVDAQCNLGICYEYGLGVVEDHVEAIKWYQKAAKLGYARALCLLGDCYRYGKGVARDDTEAIKWYQKAAEMGYAVAQFDVGFCYEYGLGVAEDDTEAVKWYRKAAEQGFSYAKVRLQELGYE